MQIFSTFYLWRVFSGVFESPGCVRYCITSTALRFIPYTDMEAVAMGICCTGCPSPAHLSQPVS